ncbi:MAG TPA: ATP-binding protein [Candidatus Dormibacteraeota bacterium]|nr:ATP-binding protein [Candidatus Dormibacteraeota bacterium]
MNGAWLDANQRRLMADVRYVAALLTRHAGAARPARPPRAGGGPPSALDRLSEAFGLSPFERLVLVLCAGVELDGRFPGLCASAHGDPQRPYPTFGLALAALPGAHWSAIAPSAALRGRRLVQLGTGAQPGLTQAPLRIEERVLHYLTGLAQPDAQLDEVLEPRRPAAEPAPSVLALADRAAAAWSAAAGGELPVLQLWGGGPEAQRSLAAATCTRLGLDLRTVAAVALPVDTSELNAFADLWSRDAVLDQACLLVDCHDLEPGDRPRELTISRLVEDGRFPLLLAGPEPRPGRRRPVITVEVSPPSRDEQRAWWHQALGDAAGPLDDYVEHIVSHFSLGEARIRAACAAAFAELPAGPVEAIGAALWDGCRAQARLPLDRLAQRVDTAVGWDDLVLPDGPAAMLREVATQVRFRSIVYDRWGFAARAGRGLGITALFAGPSGTGKTLAAEVIAGQLRLDLHRIDLSQVVSKYIGETEKNLRRVFDAAQEAGGILLFDEADALFGKRSEVRDSHDRYANIEVGYLLQRMESYAGLAILTTNQKEALDAAFLRRLRFVVDFPFPDAALRQEIWRRAFPPGAPVNRTGLDLERLARLDVAGGSIRNIALQAAFLAAGDGAPIGMRHLARAARTECAKIGKPLGPGRDEGWT